MATKRFIRKPELLEKVGMSWSLIQDTEAAGKFPKRVKLPGQNVIAWVEAEVDQWIDDMVAEQRA